MSKKSKKNKKRKKKKIKKVYPSGKEDRIKKIATLKDPEEILFKKENEAKVDRWHPLWRRDKTSIAEKSRLKKRQNRKKKPQNKIF